MRRSRDATPEKANHFLSECEGAAEQSGGVVGFTGIWNILSLV